MNARELIFMADRTKEERLKQFYEEMLLSTSTPEKMPERKNLNIHVPRKNVQILVGKIRRTRR